MKTSKVPVGEEVWFVNLQGFFGVSRHSHILCNECYEGLEPEKQKPAFRSKVKEGETIICKGCEESGF